MYLVTSFLSRTDNNPVTDADGRRIAELFADSELRTMVVNWVNEDKIMYRNVFIEEGMLVSTTLYDSKKTFEEYKNHPSHVSTLGMLKDNGYNLEFKEKDLGEK